jgi:hypothetical protein
MSQSRSGLRSWLSFLGMPSPNYLYTMHFRQRAEHRLKGLGIPFSVVLDTANDPQQVLNDVADPTVLIHQSLFTHMNKSYLCRVVLTFITEPPTLISFYITSKVDKYWQS